MKKDFIEFFCKTIVAGRLVILETVKCILNLFNIYLVYVVSMLSVPETVVKTAQDKIFKFLWKNKKDKVKRAVLCQPFSHGGMNFPNVHTVVKSLRLS